VIDLWKWEHGVDSVHDGSGEVKSVETVHVACPKCGHWMSLRAHNIDHDGNVTPSLVCVHAPCAFHDTVRLAFFQRKS
jgi:hypothetical protein